MATFKRYEALTSTSKLQHDPTEPIPRPKIRSRNPQRILHRAAPPSRKPVQRRRRIENYCVEVSLKRTKDLQSVSNELPIVCVGHF